MTKLKWENCRKHNGYSPIKGNPNASKGKKKRKQKKLYIVQFADGLWCYNSWKDVLDDNGDKCPVGSGLTMAIAIKKSFRSKWYHDKHLEKEEPTPDHPEKGKGWKLRNDP